MNRVISLSIFFFLLAQTNAQITKRNWLVGGGGNLTSTQYKSDATPNTNQTVIQVSGDVGYFFIDKFVAGIKPAFASSKVKVNTENKTSNWLELGPFVRYYFLSTENIVNVFSDISYQHGTRWVSDNETRHTNRFSFSPGVAIFFNNCVAGEITFGYSSLKYTHSSGSNNSLITGFGFQFHLEKD